MSDSEARRLGERNGLDIEEIQCDETVPDRRNRMRCGVTSDVFSRLKTRVALAVNYADQGVAATSCCGSAVT